MPAVSVQKQDFDIAAEIANLKQGRLDIGAIVTFTGTVRDMDGSLKSMTLEHYAGMTDNELDAIIAEAYGRWPLQACRIIHRYGRLKPGDNIVLVITMSAHRQAAFQAADFLMDFLKSRAPFWKSEETDAGANWIDARESDAEALNRWQD
ncbi:molybdenum cofactor biosynthesis protein MoaE [Kordiimonas aestuarii]|uniref:molybdenum cofactor biosynthesis protein MoaE n=1 Tax=Kordiimonas aestuarii TaxID=1005925 RepID=UPI0021CDF8FF|nr:molybdenum cofactor biosynthesis protein MoaE [Kordiimonas aestuarii]